MATTKKSIKRTRSATRDAKEVLEEIAGPLTFAKIVRSTRQGDALTLVEFARKLGVSRQFICDVEQGRRSVPPKTAARWAKKLGYSDVVWVKFALQAALDADGLKYKVSIEAA